MGATAKGSKHQERWRQKEAPSKLKIKMCIKYTYFLRERKEIGSPGAISRIYKEFSILKNKKANNSIRKWTKRHEETFYRRRYSNGKQHTKDAQ